MKNNNFWGPIVIVLMAIAFAVVMYKATESDRKREKKTDACVLAGGMPMQSRNNIDYCVHGGTKDPL